MKLRSSKWRSPSLFIFLILVNFSRGGLAQQSNNDLLSEPLTEKFFLGDSLIIG
jgi:hypothetical protein